MLIKNCNIIYLDKIEKGSVLIENGKIKEINPSNVNDTEVIDAEGLYLSPGFIDVHIHGAGGCDTMDGTVESINTIAKTIVQHGTTSFTPTTMTVAAEDIRKSMEVIKKLKEEGTEGANVLGAHLEGPFISPKAIGAQNPNFLLAPSVENYNKIVGDYSDAVVSITMAPEVEGAKELIKYLSDNGVTVSMGHTKATYDEAIEGIKCGACHSTHLYNAMTPFTHREPGVVGATFDTDITTETISDGIHISYPALRTAYKQKGTDKVLLVSDAMEACGMPDGQYSLGGQDVIVKNGAARLLDGTLAGSVLTLDKAVKNIYNNSNYPLNEVVRMATYNGAKHCHVEDHKGLIKEGYDADLILFNEDIEIQKVFVNGKEVYNK
ncbi:N-acetylglucosamine-6-phosphate deacetylase [Clostridium paraputrificum]|uniref:N-acetylglucosamine-6-phosphate deacetylase n=1 Tax=Clostridium paraputrificum TaxID=29363 RepID=UPI000666F158|nr:N-acetylglucosamine-6-phosphate deacetylase [Clostridium paraputrificum]MDB2106357.1 N-acetylglucosamine-6-phosphate deacetylase [Clostridium paraputrificum]MDB2113211.1 N-acetylglucosamine-6-phosphate deacetylase [Clostridium paraputrificum]